MRAEYDHDNNRVVAVETDDGRVVLTNNPRVLGAVTEWLPVDVHYPDGYDRKFNVLLDPTYVSYGYDANTNHVTVDYPNADFSPEAIRRFHAESIRGAARLRLEGTDWYFIRKMETGDAVPAEVLAEREGVRLKEQEFQDALNSLPDSELYNFTYSFTTPAEVTAPGNSPAGPVEGGDGTLYKTDATGPHEQGNPVRPLTEDEVSENVYGGALIPELSESGLSWKIQGE